MRSFFINKVLLFPYYMTLKLRHYLYDREILSSYRFDIPIISVGNISSGGTGKTPHTEFLIEELSSKEKIAVLSRGYGRTTKGFRFVSTLDTVLESGDEPLQIKRKFPQVIVAVDGNRVRAIKKLMELTQEQRPSLILMDDAFQHRRVTPSQHIVLIDYSNPPDRDNLLPFGTLRDLPSQLKRADIVLITKCPSNLSAEDQFEWERRVRLSQNQKLFFTSLSYQEPVALFDCGDKRYVYSNFAQLVTAIANPKHLEQELSSRYKIVGKLRFRDHKNFSRRDISQINNMALSSLKSVIYTTEKDAQRLLSAPALSQSTKSRLFYFPIKVAVLNEKKEELLSLY